MSDIVILSADDTLAVALNDWPAGEKRADHAELAGPTCTLPNAPDLQSFQGIARPNGDIGTRNYIGILASVNCSTTVCNAIAAEANWTLLPQYRGKAGAVPEADIKHQHRAAHDKG
jgi:hypothetical protein